MPESKERGALTEAVTYILLSVYNEPMHGYGLMQQINDYTNGRVNLGPGTLYGAINTLLEKRWIKAVGESRNTRKKEYIITDNGKAMVAQEIERLQALLAAAMDITGGKDEARLV